MRPDCAVRWTVRTAVTLPKSQDDCVQAFLRRWFSTGLRLSRLASEDFLKARVMTAEARK